MEAFDTNVEDTCQTKPKCQLCLKEESRYTCPRCNVPYCSVVCYKCVAHAPCSEGFYKDCFMTGLKDMESPDDKVKVMEMLKRVSNQKDPLNSDDEEGDNGADLAERIENLDLDEDTEEIWSRLSEKEKTEFKSMMQDGRLGELVSPWQPWWLKEQEKRPLVEEVGTNDREKPVVAAVTVSVPQILSEIPDIGLLLKNKEPSEDLKYSFINIIYAYAYISRLYNGEHRQHPDQCSQDLLSMCPSLGAATYSSVSEAIQGCLYCLAKQAKSLYVSQVFSVSAVEDTCKIIHGTGSGTDNIHDSGPNSSSCYASSVLSDLHGLFTDAVKVISQASKKNKAKHKAGTKASSQVVSSGGDLKQLKHQCFGVTKKLEFLLSWLQRYREELLHLEPMLQIEFCEMSSRLDEHKQTEKKLHQLKQHIPRNPRQPLIQELDSHGQ